jgi:tRNA-(ms[2]io[6]A)-hydroxylase
MHESITKRTDISYEILLVDKTPRNWAKKAVESVSDLLIDHAHCERKAAQSAMTLIYRYPHLHFVNELSRLIREEMVHFEQVLRFLKLYNIKFRSLKPSGYGQFLASLVNIDNQYLINHLIINGIIEARSCERMGAFSEFVNPELSTFYKKLHDAERRHCSMYIDFAQSLSKESIDWRIKEFAIKESEWLSQSSRLIRFHSPHG